MGATVPSATGTRHGMRMILVLLANIGWRAISFSTTEAGAGR
jgi:hypothetical protein